MVLDPKILLSDEQCERDWPMLRLEIAKIVTPGPWKHDLTELRSGDYDNQVEDRICMKCGASEFKNQTDSSCAVPELSTDPMEVWAENLVKMCDQDQLGAVVDDYLSGTAQWLYYQRWWIFKATPAERCVCALKALEAQP